MAIRPTAIVFVLCIFVLLNASDARLLGNKTMSKEKVMRRYLVENGLGLTPPMGYVRRITVKNMIFGSDFFVKSCYKSPKIIFFVMDILFLSNFPSCTNVNDSNIL
jgi:hypothetical protein